MRKKHNIASQCHKKMMTALSDRGEIVPPRASALIESLRAFGYSARAAVADLIDNSISASAHEIRITFWWSGEKSWFLLQDDGHGMNEAELIEAMRPGTRSPREERSPEDLGRFGLGLKTASFSQCRRLTVSTKRVGDNAALRCWDLDHVEDVGDWELLKHARASTRSILEKVMPGHCGTAVVWELLDRIAADTKADNDRDHAHFNNVIAEVRDHLAMVFHGFLARPGGLQIVLNDRIVEPWDPYLAESLYSAAR